MLNSKSVGVPTWKIIYGVGGVETGPFFALQEKVIVCD